MACPVEWTLTWSCLPTLEDSTVAQCCFTMAGTTNWRSIPHSKLTMRVIEYINMKKPKSKVLMQTVDALLGRGAVKEESASEDLESSDSGAEKCRKEKKRR